MAESMVVLVDVLMILVVVMMMQFVYVVGGIGTLQQTNLVCVSGVTVRLMMVQLLLLLLFDLILLAPFTTLGTIGIVRCAAGRWCLTFDNVHTLLDDRIPFL